MMYCCRVKASVMFLEIRTAISINWHQLSPLQDGSSWSPGRPDIFGRRAKLSGVLGPEDARSTHCDAGDATQLNGSSQFFCQSELLYVVGQADPNFLTAASTAHYRFYIVAYTGSLSLLQACIRAYTHNQTHIHASAHACAHPHKHAHASV